MTTHIRALTCFLLLWGPLLFQAVNATHGSVEPFHLNPHCKSRYSPENQNIFFFDEALGEVEHEAASSDFSSATKTIQTVFVFFPTHLFWEKRSGSLSSFTFSCECSPRGPPLGC